MIDLELTKDQLDELHKEASENPNARARKKCWWSTSMARVARIRR